MCSDEGESSGGEVKVEHEAAAAVGSGGSGKRGCEVQTNLTPLMVRGIRSADVLLRWLDLAAHGRIDEVSEGRPRRTQTSAEKLGDPDRTSSHQSSRFCQPWIGSDSTRALPLFSRQPCPTSPKLVCNSR